MKDRLCINIFERRFGISDRDEGAGVETGDSERLAARIRAGHDISKLNMHN